MRKRQQAMPPVRTDHIARWDCKVCGLCLTHHSPGPLTVSQCEAFLRGVHTHEDEHGQELDKLRSMDPNPLSSTGGGLLSAAVETQIPTENRSRSSTCQHCMGSIKLRTGVAGDWWEHYPPMPSCASLTLPPEVSGRAGLHADPPWLKEARDSGRLRHMRIRDVEQLLMTTADRIRLTTTLTPVMMLVPMDWADDLPAGSVIHDVRVHPAQVDAPVLAYGMPGAPPAGRDLRISPQDRREGTDR